MNNVTYVVYIICSMIVNLAFIALPVFLSIYTGNYNWMWLLILSVFMIGNVKITEHIHKDVDE